MALKLAEMIGNPSCDCEGLRGGGGGGIHLKLTECDRPLRQLLQHPHPNITAVCLFWGGGDPQKLAHVTLVVP